MVNKTDQNKDATAQQSSDSKIAAVRNLIFGENIEQYNSEFAYVNEKIKALREESSKNLAETVQDIESNLADLEGLTDTKFQDLNSDLNKRPADLDDVKADRVKLGMALEKIVLMLR